MRKVAIIGRCDNTRNDAPWHDPDWEKWGLAWDMGFAGDLYFETHTPNTWHDNMVSNLPKEAGGITYTEWLKSFPAERPFDTLVLLEEYFPGVMRFPMEKIAADPLLCLPGTADPYLESSIGYMLAMAKAEGVTKAAVYGIDMTADDEYAYQRPNLAYLVAVCRYSGMPVNVPRASEMWELQKLDDVDLATVDWCDAGMHRHQLEYLIGKARALGQMPSKYRPDLLTSLFTNPPRYGYCALPEKQEWGRRVFLKEKVA